VKCKPSAFLILFLSVLLIRNAFATPTYHLPLVTTIPAGLKVHFGNIWLYSTDVPIHVTSFFQDSSGNVWFNFTVITPGFEDLQQIFSAYDAQSVYVNDVNYTYGGMWFKSLGIVWIQEYLYILDYPANFSVQYAIPSFPFLTVLVHDLTRDTYFDNHINMTIDGVVYTTPFTVALDPDLSYTLIAPYEYPFNASEQWVYRFKIWEDGETSLVRTIHITNNTGLIADYVEATWVLPVYIPWDLAYFVIGLSALVLLVFSTTYIAYKLKHGQVIEGLGWGIVLLVISIGLIMVWLAR
jgi:hypothetical protein